jgi:hypothetical protein
MMGDYKNDGRKVPFWFSEAEQAEVDQESIEERICFWWAFSTAEIGTYWHKFLFTPVDEENIPHGIQRVLGYYCGRWDIVLERLFEHGKLISEKRFYPVKAEHCHLPYDPRVIPYVEGKDRKLSCYDWNTHKWYEV